MSVLDRAALEQSPLADLHEIASELSIDTYRRLRRADLIQAILDKQDGVDQAASGDAEEPQGDEPAQADGETASARNGETGESASGEDVASPSGSDDAPASGQDEATAVGEDDATGPSAGSATSGEDDASAADGEDTSATSEEPESADAEPDADAEDRPAPRRRRGRRGGRGRSAAREESAPGEEDHEPVEPVEPVQRPVEPVERVRTADQPADDEIVEGAVELLPNGSGFVRVRPPEPSEDDVYISAAQVKRCELVSGDRVSGPKRTPRRSERFASLIRIDTINGRPATELADSVRFDDLPAAFPDDRFRLGSEDPTVKAIEWLTPFGKGSRVVIVGPARSGKTEALRRVASALAAHDGLVLSLALAGVRPEEISDWSRGPLAPAVAVSFALSSDAQSVAIEPVIDQARRLAARGADAVVLIDTLDGLPPHAARKLLAAARNIVDGGSLTVIATASAPVGGETTVIALDASLASTDRFPALDIVLSGTMRPELLVGEAGAKAIAKTRAEALDR
jgi:transcription termination factor Rho